MNAESTGKTMIRLMMKSLIAAGAVISLASGAALATGGKTAPYKEHEWHFSGVFGSYDTQAVQRGYQVYETVCSQCHAVEHIAFRNLGEKGGPFHLAECPEGVPEGVDCANPNDNPIIKSIAANYKYKVIDGPDETGEMFERAPVPSDWIPAPFRNEQQARMANGGALPPDLSLIIKARHHGPNYIYSLLTGYETPPDTVTISPAQHYNPYFAGDMSQLLKPELINDEGHPVEGVEVPSGGVLAMAPPLSDGVVDYVDPNTPETVEQYAKDVVEFLAWASEPKLEARKKLGFMTIAYLLILACILYWSYREIWSKVDH
jgi:ubiquinol-cytochrome c reductase cytochrome c1 subunit